MFQFNRELYIERTMAYSAKQARLIMCRRIAKKQEVPAWQVLQYFNENEDKFDVQLETEFTES